MSPGLIATPLWSKLSEEARQSMYEGAASRLPTRRVGQPEDVTNAIAYLASTPSSTVLVDGGASIV
ncbi:SDR family oxidoreductase [Pseudomonas orientalis]|uniref:SDR family oxidoreductase n=1 Tax=Pseudomonas orientalis TaxID=76758 RepID=UPI001A938850|nr:SDR family oxidoreductase [Pseudomonas orientalis]